MKDVRFLQEEEEEALKRTQIDLGSERHFNRGKLESWRIRWIEGFWVLIHHGKVDRSGGARRGEESGSNRQRGIGFIPFLTLSF